MAGEPSFNRDEFGARQAQMSDGWFRRLQARGVDVDAHIAMRQRAYLDRWVEAARFVAPGSRLLDIGGGVLFPDLFQFILDRNFDYHYTDVDSGILHGVRERAAKFGFEPSRFTNGFNDKLAFPTSSMDAIFSSHCIEHSFDLEATFSELYRVLAPDGMLLMAVPLGWDRNPEHPYFLGHDEWLALIEDSGFEIRVAQLGREYPEEGHDLFVAARRLAGSPWIKRLDPSNYRKVHYITLSPDDPSIIYDCETDQRPDGVICRDDWKIHWQIPPNTREILPVMVRHSFSGIVQLTAGSNTAVADLYSTFAYMQPARIEMQSDPTSRRLTIRSVGRNPISRGQEGVLSAILYR